MTLNDNPLVSAEKRFKLLHKRRDWLITYKSARFQFEKDNLGVICKMYINPFIKSKRADDLITRINKELGQLEDFLKHFK